MDRNKPGSNRGGKNKGPLHTGAIFALGAKSSRVEIQDNKRPGLTTTKPGPTLPTISGVDRKRELPSSSSSNLPAKKVKLEGSTSRSASGSPASTSSDSWELVAIDCDPSDLSSSVARAMEQGDSGKAKSLLCGAIKLLKTQRAKPDKVLYLSLMYVASVMPYLFTSENVVQALSSLLRRDPTSNFKSKGNPSVPALAANLLLRGFQDRKNWPEIFVKVYVEDSIGERVWVDMEETKGFVDNVVTAFNTRPTNKALLPADFLAGPGGRSDSPATVSSVGSAANTDDEAEGEGTSGLSGSTKLKLEAMPTMPRYRDCVDAVENIVMEAVKEQLSRRQTPEAVGRNLLRLLATASGLSEVRLISAPRLELWLQNPKLMRATQELLLAICANCVNPVAQPDLEVIGHLLKMRLKTKAVTNLYLSGIKELIAAHTDNLTLVLKITIYNELSNARSPNNMAVINVIFQTLPESAAAVMADVFQELLMNRDDYLRSLRGLLREVVRQLRHDIPLAALCRALMRDRSRDQTFKEFQFKERMMAATADLVALCIMVAVSPAVREAAARNDRREIQVLQNYRSLVAKIQRDSVWWLQETVPRMYHPSGQDFNHALRKVLFLEPAEQYVGKDNCLSENDRETIFRLASKVPVLQNTLMRLASMGVSKEHPITCADLIDVMERIVYRAASLQCEGTSPLIMEKPDIFQLMFELCTYRHPENISLPQGYHPPQLAISTLYWKAWEMLLVIAAHNPATFGSAGWDKYPMLRAFMEMCITNHFTFPPPTMALLEEEGREASLAALERQQILEFETHLAAASTKVTITEHNSLLLSQLTALDPTGSARRPPPYVLSRLQEQNKELHLGHRLCKSRRPDFLLDVIQRQGASQAMPWLADLVESSEGALSHLPVQCLCEFLLSESSLDASPSDAPTSSISESSSAQAQQRQVKQQQLLTHLRNLLNDSTSPDSATQCCEVLEYFLRRLGSTQAPSRVLAIKGLKLLLLPPTEEDEEEPSSGPYAWLLQHLPLLPHFPMARPQAILALRQACLTENDLSAIRAYLAFLATHAVQDPLQEMQDLVLDLAQLIVERNTVMAALLPDPEEGALTTIEETAALATQHALMVMFTAYVQKAREPRREAYTWSESQDQILVTWSSGEESTMHILVVHAMIILLTFGPGKDLELFTELKEIWVPANREPPKAFLVDTSEEALLIPDWLKLRMIQSSAPGLVDAALIDLDPQQLLLFVQSFGIPPLNMSKLLRLLDRAIETDSEMVREAVQDKTYMRQLIEVQHCRGATGGQQFLEFLCEPTASPQEVVMSTPSSIDIVAMVRPPLPSAPPIPPLKVSVEEVAVLLGQAFNPQASDNVEALTAGSRAYSRLYRGICQEISSKKTNLLLKSSVTLLCKLLDISLLLANPQFSCPIFRLAVTSIKSPDSLHVEMVQLARRVVELDRCHPLADILSSLVPHAPVPQLEDQMEKLLLEARPADLQPDTSKQVLVKAIDILESAPSGSTKSSQMGLMMDWVSILEPEMIGICPEQQMKILFNRGGKEYRPYLLTLLTHRTSWATLHMVMTKLLEKWDPNQDPGAVLDFLWALIGNPKLWQGREKRTPKHHVVEDILCLSKTQFLALLDYVVDEGQGNSSTDVTNLAKPKEILDARTPLLLQCLRPEMLQYVVRHLTPTMMARDKPRSQFSRLLLLQLYMAIPAITQHLNDAERETLLLASPESTSLILKGTCTLDPTSHCLLSALAAAPGQGKDWTRRAMEFELGARKMAATHPVLILRQLPMLAASLRGRVHLDTQVFRARGHLLLFTQTLGLLELLQPHIFQPEYAEPLEDILDCFFQMFQRHHGQTKDVLTALSRSVTLLQSFVSYDAQRALKYLQRHCQLLHELHGVHRDLGLQSLLAGLSLPARDGDEPELLVAAAMGTQSSEVQGPGNTARLQSQVAQLQSKIARQAQGEDIQLMLQELDHLSQRRPAVLDSCTDMLSSLVLSPAGGVRSLAHLLLLRLLRHAPGSAAACVPAYLRCLDSPNPDIQASALERLPDVIVCAQEHALLLLERLFKLGVRSGVHTVPHISRAVALLQLQSGC